MSQQRSLYEPAAAGPRGSAAGKRPGPPLRRLPQVPNRATPGRSSAPAVHSALRCSARCCHAPPHHRKGTIPSWPAALHKPADTRRSPRQPHWVQFLQTFQFRRFPARRAAARYWIRPGRSAQPHQQGFPARQGPARQGHRESEFQRPGFQRPEFQPSGSPRWLMPGRKPGPGRRTQEPETFRAMPGRSPQERGQAGSPSACWLAHRPSEQAKAWRLPPAWTRATAWQ